MSGKGLSEIVKYTLNDCDIYDVPEKVNELTELDNMHSYIYEFDSI